MDKIFYKNKFIGFRLRFLVKGSNPLTDGAEPLQVVTLKHPKGVYLKAHMHNPLKRTTLSLQECLIITKVPRFSFEIDEGSVGIAINYDKQQLKKAILKLLTNRKVYAKFRSQAIKFGSNFIWEKTFTQAFVGSLNRFNRNL